MHISLLLFIVFSLITITRCINVIAQETIPDSTSVPTVNEKDTLNIEEEEEEDGESGRKRKGLKISSVKVDKQKINAEITQLLKKAEKCIAGGPKNYSKTIELFDKIFQKSEEHANANFNAGLFYLEKSEEPAKAVSYFEMAYRKKPKIDKRILEYIGRAYQAGGDYRKAISFYEKYIEDIKKAFPTVSEDILDEKLGDTYWKLNECKASIKLRNEPVRVYVDNLGEIVNSPEHDYDPFILPDESMLYFTSRRKTDKNKGIAEVDAHFYEDIFVIKNNEGNWGNPQPIEGNINIKTNNAIVGLSFDGQTMLLYKDINNGDIYTAKLKGKNWSSPKNFRAINSKYQESSACFTADGNTVYFVSNNIDGYGKKDIYVARKIDKKKWAAPENIGSTINTAFDEDRVYIHPNGKTLYFSSKGHPGLGGFDVFSSTFDGKAWSKPKNIGFPINTAYDDVSYVVTANEKYAYYASTNPNNKNSKDLYMVTFLGPEKPGVLNTEDNLLSNTTQPLEETVIEAPVEVRQNELTILQGLIRDSLTTLPVGATIEVIDNEKNELVGTYEANTETGKYIISLPSGRNYGIAVKAKDYLFHSENIVVPVATNYQVYKKDFELKKLHTGTTIVLRNVFFDFGQATVRAESYPELDRLVGLLKEFPNVTIEISGHTDNVSSAAFNQQLSEKRAKTVVEYLAEKGISTDRLTFAGYGLTQPIVPNTDEESRAQNRRTEFKVLRTDYKPVKK